MPVHNDDFPVPFPVFAKKLVKTSDEIWIHLMNLDHGGRKLTEKEWFELLERVKRS